MTVCRGPFSTSLEQTKQKYRNQNGVVTENKKSLTHPIDTRKKTKSKKNARQINQ